MYHKLILIILLVFVFTSCSKDNDITFDSENREFCEFQWIPEIGVPDSKSP